MNTQILIGGQALRQLGSDRYTNDTDYLINDKSSKEAFITSESVDYLNANGHKMFAEIYTKEEGNAIASLNHYWSLKLMHLSNTAKTSISEKQMLVSMTLSS